MRLLTDQNEINETFSLCKFRLISHSFGEEDHNRNNLILGYYREDKLVAACKLNPRTDFKKMIELTFLAQLEKSLESTVWCVTSLAVREPLKNDFLIVRFFGDLYEFLSSRGIRASLMLSPLHLEPTFVRLGYRNVGPKRWLGDEEPASLLLHVMDA